MDLQPAGQVSAVTQDTRAKSRPYQEPWALAPSLQALNRLLGRESLQVCSDMITCHCFPLCFCCLEQLRMLVSLMSSLPMPDGAGGPLELDSRVEWGWVFGRVIGTLPIYIRCKTQLLFWFQLPAQAALWKAVGDGLSFSISTKCIEIWFELLTLGFGLAWPWLLQAFTEPADMCMYVSIY